MRNLADVLDHRARTSPDRVAIKEFRSSAQSLTEFTYSELDQRARAVAAMILSRVQAGDRVLLLGGTPSEYLVAFFGCLYAEAIPVSGLPPFPPRPATPSTRQAGRQARLLGVLKNSAARAWIGPATLVAQFARSLPESFEKPTPLSLDGITGPHNGRSSIHQRTGQEIAYLQYTSGSTGLPAGVMVTNQNLLRNLEAQRIAFDIQDDDIGVSWLPLFHDLGLIGAALFSLYCGFPIILMPPASFAERPRRWIDIMSSERGTISWAPNFAYRLCARELQPEQMSGLDLRRWRFAMNAAEPVWAETVREFTRTFAGVGFRPEAMRPCYGLAEATLVVTASSPLSSPTVLRAARAAFEDGRLTPAQQNEPSLDLVSCGKPIAGVDIATVDARERVRCEDGRIGEIWVRGEGVAAGYFNAQDATAQVFHASLADTEAAYLRTGDLGAIVDSELYIVGRLKDLIIIRGVNFHPHELERSAQGVHASIRQEGCCAFSVDVDDEERVVVVCELERGKTADWPRAAEGVRRQLFDDFGLEVHAIAFVPVGAIPKTPSGKLQRRQCRTLYLRGELAILGESLPLEHRSSPPLRDVTGQLPVDEDGVCVWLGRRLGVSALAGERVRRSKLADLGVGSLQITQLAGVLREEFGILITAAEIFDMGSISRIAAHISRTSLK